MDVIIEGTGAMACLFAARFSQANIGVTLSGTWREAMKVIEEKGVRLAEVDGSEHSYPVHVVERGHRNGNYEHAFVLVKSWQTGESAAHLKNCMFSNGLALTLQNGLGNQEILEAALGAKRVCRGVTTSGATLLGPGYVRAGGIGKVSLGSHYGIESMADILHHAGFNVEIVSDSLGLLWGKLIINAAINPLTALLRVPNGELLERPNARALMSEVAREAASVAEAKKIKLPYSNPVAVVEEVAKRTASNHSSMLQDVLRGAPTEIDSINGAIVQAGEEVGIPTPVNLTLWRLVKSSERSNGKSIIE